MTGRSPRTARAAASAASARRGGPHFRSSSGSTAGPSAASDRLQRLSRPARQRDALAVPQHRAEPARVAQLQPAAAHVDVGLDEVGAGLGRRAGRRGSFPGPVGDQQEPAAHSSSGRRGLPRHEEVDPGAELGRVVGDPLDVARHQDGGRRPGAHARLARRLGHGRRAPGRASGSARAASATARSPASRSARATACTASAEGVDRPPRPSARSAAAPAPPRSRAAAPSPPGARSRRRGCPPAPAPRPRSGPRAAGAGRSRRWTSSGAATGSALSSAALRRSISRSPSATASATDGSESSQPAIARSTCGERERGQLAQVLAQRREVGGRIGARRRSPAPDRRSRFSRKAAMPSWASSVAALRHMTPLAWR